ncbi:hypothetical protein ANAPC5_01351 [Anaplasma phagocytophilum]|nr:hypothetical protein ANAPC5_01351 [Anaplasma phagocytophilum]
METIQKLKPKLSVGIEGIPIFIAKGCAEVVCPILHHISNLSLESGVFPTMWKSSVVIPVFKPGDRSNVNNYRPASLLCTLSNVFEIILHNLL